MPTRILKKHDVDESVLDLALMRIRRAYELHDRVAVSFSGGKDSTVVLNLALQVARERGQTPLDVFFWDEEVIAPETESYVARVAALPDVALRWLCLPVTHRNGCSTRAPFWWPWDPESRDLWVRTMPDVAESALEGFERHQIPKTNRLLFPPGQTVGVLLGIRADESMSRRQGVSMRREDNYLISDAAAPGVTLVKPIYDWRTVDVWTAPHTLGWDYNHAYDLMALAGISPSQQRVAPPYGEQPMQSLWMWQVCWPDLWDRMCERVPGALTAARYAKTELYGAGGSSRLNPPAGMSWEEAISFYLARHPETVRSFTAKRLKSFLSAHRRATADPVPDRDPHPASGLSWAYMLRVAMRGDLKGRENPLKFVAGVEHGTRY